MDQKKQCQNCKHFKIFQKPFNYKGDCLKDGGITKSGYFAVTGIDCCCDNFKSV